MRTVNEFPDQRFKGMVDQIVQVFERITYSLLFLMIIMILNRFYTRNKRKEEKNDKMGISSWKLKEWRNLKEIQPHGRNGKARRNVYSMEADMRKFYQVERTQNPIRKETRSFIHNYPLQRLMVPHITLSRNILSLRTDMWHGMLSLIGTIGTTLKMKHPQIFNQNLTG